VPDSYVWRDSFIRVTRLIHMFDMTHSYVSRDSFIYLTWLIYTCHVTHSYVRHESFICVKWLIQWSYRDLEPSHTAWFVRYELFISVTWLIQLSHTRKKPSHTAGSKHLNVYWSMRKRCKSNFRLSLHHQWELNMNIYMHKCINKNVYIMYPE